MRCILILLAGSWIGNFMEAEEPLHVSVKGPAALTEAMKFLSDYHEVSYGYEEDVIPLLAYDESNGLGARGRRSQSLSFTLYPDNNVTDNLEVLRRSIETQIDTWVVEAEARVVDGIPILLISESNEDDEVKGLARPRQVSGSYTFDGLIHELATAQRDSLEQAGVLIYRTWGHVIIRPRVRYQLMGDWKNPREGMLAMIQYIEQERNVRCGYQFRALIFMAGRGYSCSLDIVSQDSQFPQLQKGGTVMHLYGGALDLTSAKILAKEGEWVFVARQRPAVLSEIKALTGPARGAALAGRRGVRFASENHIRDYTPLTLRMHRLPKESMAVVLERAVNDDEAISDACGPIQILPRNGGGHYLYFGAGKGHTQHSFAQEVPAISLEAGLTLANAVHMLYQALPETPEPPLTLVPGPWQDHILSEDIELPERPFGSMICDLLSAAGFDPGIIRVHYDLLSEGYHFTYTVTESAEE